MATTRIMPLHIGKGRSVGTAVSDILEYVKDTEKTDQGRLVTCFQCNPEIADAEFCFSKRRYQTSTGRKQENDVIAYHVRQSFKPGEITPEEANRLGCEFAARFLKGNHAYIVCTHIDKKHIHNHIIWNSTALSCDRKFRNFWGSTKAVRHLSDLICAENGLSIVEHPNRHGKSYNKWRGERAEPTQLEQVRSAIDAALSQKPADWDAFVALLAENGCEVKRRGKTLSFRGAGWERFIRADRLGENYLEAALLDAILGRREHTPQRTAIIGAPQTPSLLIDIDAKIRAGKGVGYQRWASKFNAKQLGQTMTYLKEHDLMNYADPVTLYIITEETDKERVKPLFRLLLAMICRKLASGMTYEKIGESRRAKSPNTHKLLMLIDEFPSFGKLEVIQKSLAFLAGYGIRFYLIAQDLAQLRSREEGYGENEAITSNCHIQVAFTPQKLETAKYLSQLTGQTTVSYAEIAMSGSRLSLFQSNMTKTYRDVSRPLMTEDECLRMRGPKMKGDVMIEGGDMLLFYAGIPAIRGIQMPYFLDPVLQKRSCVDPPARTDITIDSNKEKKVPQSAEAEDAEPAFAL